MFNYATQRHISHLLLIDTESVATMRTLVRNAADLYRCFCEISGTSTYYHYTLVLVFPESRTDLVEPVAELKSETEQLGVKCHVHTVANADMFLVKGKASLLSCSLWTIAGATLVNDEPVPLVNAELLLSLANCSEGIYRLGKGQHAALIGDATTIGTSLLGLREDHNLSDVLVALSAGVSRSRSVPTARRKWWQFWK